MIIGNLQMDRVITGGGVKEKVPQIGATISSRVITFVLFHSVLMKRLLR